MAETVGTVFAALSIIDLCDKYGKRLVSLCRQYQNYDAGLDEIILSIQGAWLKMEVQLRALTALWDKLHPPLQALYHDVLTSLGTKLMSAFESFQVTQGHSNAASTMRQKLKVVYLKRQLTQTVADMEEWQKKFDPSWYLITRIANPDVDKRLDHVKARVPQPAAAPSTRLAKMRESINQISSQSMEETGQSIFKDAAVIANEMSRIKGTTAYLSKYKGGGRPILLDPANRAGQTSTATARVNIRDLARLLLHVDPATFNLLRCDGVAELPTSQGTEKQTQNERQFHLLFEIPDGLSSPRTLRTLLEDTPKVSLSDRFQLAKQLARSVTFVHAAGFVHKNIRPETVLVFNDTDNKLRRESLGSSFLIGFERVRKAEGRTDKFGDLEWEKNLYRHPFRQGLQPEDIFEMRHDIYSLGVCLLEIALWKSFIRTSTIMKDEREGEEREELRQDTLGTQSGPWSKLNISTDLTDENHRRGALAIKSKLVALAKDALPSLVGERYTRVALACLCCLDEDSEDNSFRYEKNLEDKDGIIVGVRYIENVLSKLEELFV
ncbi:hypothetical protein BJY00DRAFT_105548 [Aspergillus carlsbadensis]|nr:hypothetical protein BJY00DRAFT_105548 [Aspergillus carlsbadensis]